MKPKSLVLACIAASAALLGGCSEKGSAPTVVMEEVQAPKPSLPSVPTIPTPSVPEIYPDGSYSVYGLRKNILKTLDTKVDVTAIIVEIYQKPPCPEGETCFPLMPHLFLADEKDEKLAPRRLRLAGYARSFLDMEDQKARDEKGVQEEPPPDGMYEAPVVWDWRLGQKYKVTGLFTRNSATGFMSTDGLLEYQDQKCLDCPPPSEDTDKK